MKTNQQIEACKAALDFIKRNYPLEHGNPDLGRVWAMLETAIDEREKK